MYIRNSRKQFIAATLSLAGLLSGLVLPAYAGSYQQQWAIVPTRARSSSAAQFGVSSNVNDSPASLESATQTEDEVRESARAAYSKLPLIFEANRGQSSKEVKFISRNAGYNLFLTQTEAVMALRGTDESKKAKAKVPRSSANSPASSFGALRIRLIGANKRAQVEGVYELPSKVSYFIGNDPEKWQTELATYGRVRYNRVYPGIDMIYYGSQRQLEYDFVVAPGSNFRNIRLAFNGTSKVKIDAQGELVLRMSGGYEIRQRKPLAYQEVNGVRREIASRYVIKGKNRVGFQVGHYDREVPLVIDPVLVYSTYLGGSSGDSGSGIAVDSSGNVYVTGSTFSADFPTASPFQSSSPADFNPDDVFVVKLNASGTALIFSTYLGGQGSDEGRAIAVDSSGNVYVAGQTGSQDNPNTPQNEGFPVANAVQPTRHLSVDGFVTKLNPTGSALIYSTYLGGDSRDICYSIAVDNDGDAYLTGSTQSPNFPTVNALQTKIASTPQNCGGFGGCIYDDDAFVTKFAAAGAFVYSTYFGGAGGDTGFSIAVDSVGNAYVTGGTISNNFPLANALQSTFNGSTTPFVSKLNANGSALVYSTYLGSRGDGFGIAVDSSGNAYVTGETSATDFPTVNPFQSKIAGVIKQNGSHPEDAFVSKFNAAGSALVYSTYLGGSSDDFADGIAIDSAGSAYVIGGTSSNDFPTAIPIQGYGGGNCGNFVPVPCTDAFITKLNPIGNALVYSTYLGGSGGDAGSNPNGSAIAVDASGNACITGQTNSSNFPTTQGAFQGSLSGTSDAFIAKISSAPPNPIDDPQNFVRQHYLDFLNREPDASGLAFWINEITSCGTDPQCIEVKRINVSAAFFLSIEFQQTGYLVERIYKASYGDGNGTSTLGGTHQLPVPIMRLNEFLPDTREISQGVIVGQTGWETVLENNKQAFTSEFVSRSRLTSAYATTLSPAQFVDMLFANAGVPPSAAERQAAINEFGSATNTSDVAARVRALRRVAENSTLANQEFNRAFVLMQYFGYLRRNPNDPQDTDYTGYDFWLTKLNQFNGNFQNAEMVKAFITSSEYRQRF
jgi:hypothetical protein